MQWSSILVDDPFIHLKLNNCTVHPIVRQIDQKFSIVDSPLNCGLHKSTWYYLLFFLLELRVLWHLIEQIIPLQLSLLNPAVKYVTTLTMWKIWWTFVSCLFIYLLTPTNFYYAHRVCLSFLLQLAYRDISAKFIITDRKSVIIMINF